MECKGNAIVFDKPRSAVWKEVRFPEVTEESVVVATRYSGISLGTEMALYEGIGLEESNSYYPMIPGYEEVGEVVYAGPKAAPDARGVPFRPGDRVMANEVRRYPDFCAAWGGHAAFAVKNPETAPAPMDELARIPENVSYPEAVVAYLAAVALKGVDALAVRPGETVMVVGMGCVGLSALQLAGIAGAGRLIAADITPGRLARAARYTEHRIDLRNCGNPADAIRACNDGKLADAVIEASGCPDAVSPLADYVRPGGRIHLQGQYRAPIVITRYARWNGADLSITCSIATEAGCKARILKLISEKKLDAKLFDRIVPITEAPQSYAAIAADRYKYLKILFNWEGAK